MKNFLKGKFATIAIVIATVILAGIAIFTAVRLYQLRKQAVAPTAPESKPEAAGSKILRCEPVTIKIPGTPGPSPTPGVPTCIGIKAFDKTWKLLTETDLSNLETGDTVRLTIEGSPSSSPDPDVINTVDVLFNVAKFNFQGSAGWTSTTLKKSGTNIFYFDYIIPDNVTNFIIKAQGGYGPLTRETWVACTDLTFSLGATPTPTATPTGTPTSTPTPTSGPGEPNGCGGTCGSNANCKSDLYCYNGFCKNPSCPTDGDCVCSGGGATPTPTSGGESMATATPTSASLAEEPALPDAGTSLPTIIGVGIGILLLLGSLLLAL